MIKNICYIGAGYLSDATTAIITQKCRHIKVTFLI